MRRTTTTTTRAAITIVLTIAFAVGAAVPAGAAEPWFEERARVGINVTGTYTPIVGNFGGDAGDDIYWYAPGSAPEKLWTSYPGPGFTNTDPSRNVVGSYVPLVGDFGYGELDDIFWWNPVTGSASLWLFRVDGTVSISGASVRKRYAPFVLRHGDFGGSRNDEIVWYAPGPANDFVWSFEGDGGQHTSVAVTIPGTPEPVVGDFDGDHDADVLWYTPGPTADPLWRSTGPGTFSSSTFQVNGRYQPVVGDFTPFHDGASDILWFQPGANVDPLWFGDAAGSFANRITPDVPGQGTGIALHDSPQDVVFTWDQVGTDRIWHLIEGGAIYSAPSGNTELPMGYQPVVGDFGGERSVIFWYKPGTAPERMFLPPV